MSLTFSGTKETARMKVEGVVDTGLTKPQFKIEGCSKGVEKTIQVKISNKTGSPWPEAYNLHIESANDQVSLTPVLLPRLEKVHFVIIAVTYKSDRIEQNNFDKYYFKVKTPSGAPVGRTMEVEF